MATTHKLQMHRPHAVKLLSPRPCVRRFALVRTRLLNKKRPALTEDAASYSDSSDDERPTTSGAGDIRTLVLFDERHIPSWRPELAIYAPFGALLAAFRSALWIMGIALDQPWFRNQAVVDGYLRLLGVTVTWRHAERVPRGRHVMVSNHCSVGDLMMLFSHPALPQRYTHLITSSLPAQVTRARHLPVLMRPASPATYEELAAPADPSPVHLFPEGGMTNGRGMLRFSRGFTRILQQQEQQQQYQHGCGNAGGDGEAAAAAHTAAGPTSAASALPVVPVALRVRSSLAGLNTHTLTSSFLANLFWFGFSPRTELEATVLPAISPMPGEARGAFVNRVQAAIAEELGVKVYDMTIQQKRQLAGGRRS